ncbi:MAG: transcriptional regulator [Bacteroidetes bacterium RIFOXYA2_FULL_33_7]|nr:MAG: transcriptional regulator [Bacteroidetes bacterium RIFOXYA12_FULL_33_9]OFY89451.1 MAG: transcriptional regulator [Bacteroidetes bacterium RIFOXYA2_FULL_33_7]
MIQKESFGELIRKLREGEGLPLRKVAAQLDIDPSTLGKIERNERTANKEMIEKLGEIFSIDSEQLLISFLSDKVAFELMKEDCANDVLKVAEEKVKYFKKTTKI